jgi:hypothetical protein
MDQHLIERTSIMWSEMLTAECPDRLAIFVTPRPLPVGIREDGQFDLFDAVDKTVTLGDAEIA